MSKTVINSMIVKMKKAKIVTKVSPWLHEQKEDARYVGLRLTDWEEIISSDNNFIARFSSKERKGFVTILLANKAPFTFLTHKPVTKEDKWELILGNLKRRLNRDKTEYKSGKYQIDNLYKKIADDLK